VTVVVGLREGSKTWGKAAEAGLNVMETSKAAAEGDIIMILTPDTSQSKIYEESLKPNLKAGDYIAFAHGFNIHFDAIVAPDDVNVFMVAPKGPGHLVRRTYEQGFGVPALLAVHQDPSGDTHDIGLAYAMAIGGTRAGVIETTFKEETETDLFGEQVVLCGGLTKLIQTAFEVLTDAGYKPEVAYFECLHEVKLIVDLMYIGGISTMRYSISDTAEWGDYVSGKRVINDDTRKEMERILAEIQDGSFAREWIKENEDGLPNFNKIRGEESTHLIERVGEPLREMMSAAMQLGEGKKDRFLDQK
jgi:ketol-acid reductoisomerase